jgi:hypothetical protein
MRASSGMACLSNRPDQVFADVHAIEVSAFNELAATNTRTQKMMARRKVLTPLSPLVCVYSRRL